MERFTETDCSKCGVPVNVDLDPQGDLVRYDDAQRALDAEREKVKELECYRALWKRRDDELTGVLAQLATFKAQVKQLDRTLADVYQQRDGLQAQLRQVREDIKRVECMNEAEMPPEIWTDINGYAARTRFKGGVKYIRAAQDAGKEDEP